MYAVIADPHLGNLTKAQEESFLSELKKLRKEKLKVIWLGDVFDLVWLRTAYISYGYLIENGDHFVIGNHDFPLIVNNKHKLFFKLGESLFLHGDLVDFGYFTARMEVFWKNVFSLPPTVTLFDVFAYLMYPRWKFSDAYKLYMLMDRLPKSVLDLFSHDPSTKKPGMLKSLYLFFYLLRRAYRYLDAPDSFDAIAKLFEQEHLVLPKPRGTSLFGYFTKDPEELHKRVHFMYTNLLPGVSNIFIGHIHTPSDIKRGFRRLITVGSWKTSPQHGVYPTVPLVDSSGNIIEIREYNR